MLKIPRIHPSHAVVILREELFMLINKLPTVYEIISGRVKAPPLGAARKPAVPKPPRPPSVRKTQQISPHIHSRAWFIK